jgi:hypothetical protein
MIVFVCLLLSQAELRPLAYRLELAVAVFEHASRMASGGR